MITTQSKLMEANKDIEFLKDELAEANIRIQEFIDAIDKQESDLIQLERQCEELEQKCKEYKTKYERVKYDRDNPWWKFW